MTRENLKTIESVEERYTTEKFIYEVKRGKIDGTQISVGVDVFSNPKEQMAIGTLNWEYGKLRTSSFPLDSDISEHINALKDIVADTVAVTAPTNESN